MRGLVRIGLALVLLVALAGLALILVPAERVAALAAGEFERMTGRALVIGGKVRPTIWPVLGVAAQDVRLANADWSEEGPMLMADRLEIGVNAGALFGGAVRITTLAVEGMALTLERAADGRGNWELGGAAGFGGGGTGQPGGAVVPVVTLDRAVLEGRVVFLDHATGRRIVLDDLEVEAQLADAAGPLTLTARAAVAGQPLALDLRAGDAAAFLAGRVGPLTTEATAGGSVVRFDGRGGIAPPVGEGRLEAELADLRALAGLAGMEVPDLPEGLGRRVRDLRGDVTLTSAGSLHLRDAVVLLDANRLAGAADITFDGPRPKVAAQVDAGQLLLAGLGGAPATGTGAAADAGWPRGTIDVSALGLADAEVALRFAGADLGGTKLGPARLLLTLDRARAVIEAREVQAFGGTIAGQFVINGRGGLSVGGDLAFAGIAMQQLLRDLAGYDRLLADGDLKVNFLGVGNSVAAIMASLRGEGRLALGKGELRGLDLLGMLRTLDPGFVGEGQRTIFDGMSASFTMAGGVLANDDLVLAAPFLTAKGQGTVGLGAQVLDYRITPTALTKADGTGGVAVPLVISGPWSAPAFRLDLKALADQELAVERAKLEARAQEAAAEAEARLRARAEAELGLVQQDGESVEDAARRRAQEAIEEEARKALGGLLGGN